MHLLSSLTSLSALKHIPLILLAMNELLSLASKQLSRWSVMCREMNGLLWLAV